jgi:hypothetical protein
MDTRQIIDETVDEILEGHEIGMLDEKNLSLILSIMASKIESIHNDAALKRFKKILNKEIEQ